MLFSDKEVAEYVNTHFEPVWESARPVPKITMDFGNGHVIKRTLRGNIATYICFSDGQTLDVLPNIYDSASYKKNLEKLSDLAHTLQSKQTIDRQTKVQAYHRSAVDRVGVQELVAPMAAMFVQKVTNAQHQQTDSSGKSDITKWSELYEDTLDNEIFWRKKIHSMLAEMAPPQPLAVNKRIYKEVLHCDLDDPYLGLLGDTATKARYPFQQ